MASDFFSKFGKNRERQLMRVRATMFTMTNAVAIGGVALLVFAAPWLAPTDAQADTTTTCGPGSSCA